MTGRRAVSDSRRPRLESGAVFAGWVGVAMAATIAVSFLLVIPIEPIYWLMTPFAGLLIGYYADQRSDVGRGEWGRTMKNAVYAGVLTAVTLALLLLAVKALFFFADNGYRDEGKSLTCPSGAGCVYARYLDDGKGPQLVSAGVTDVNSFTSFYWTQQFTTAGTLLIVASVAGVFGGALYGVTRPRAG